MGGTSGTVCDGRKLKSSFFWAKALVGRAWPRGPAPALVLPTKCAFQRFFPHCFGIKLPPQTRRKLTGVLNPLLANVGETQQVPSWGGMRWVKSPLHR